MYQYNANGQKVPMSSAKMNMIRENYKSGASDSSSSSKSKMWLWIIVAIVVVVDLVGIFLWLRANKANASSTASMGMRRGGNYKKWGFRFY